MLDAGGLALVYSHTQALIARKREIEGKEPSGLFVTGPGHGGAQILPSRSFQNQAADDPAGIHSMAPADLYSRLLYRIISAPAILSQLFIEGAISRFYPDYPSTVEGLTKFIKAFSWPKGFVSNILEIVLSLLKQPTSASHRMSTPRFVQPCDRKAGAYHPFFFLSSYRPQDVFTREESLDTLSVRTLASPTGDRGTHPSPQLVLTAAFSTCPI